ncbi:MAG TPA: mechanosensitive ion channel family protein [Acidimicrobiales bacterium]|nr:mechanosensitive ion channel family protein [Acidimicrobiales bacterium]
MANDNGYIFDLLEELGFSEFAARTGQFLLGRPLAIFLIIVVAFAISRVASRIANGWVDALVARSALPARAVRSAARAKTLASVVASLVRVVIWTMAVLLILGRLGIDLGPFIAGASIVGFALGFGAQSLVRDFLAGFFIIAEDQFGVGDVITVNEATGTVEDVTLRVTQIRSTDGTVWFIPNGEIKKVGNSAKDWSRAIVDIVLLSGADVVAATAVIADEIAKFGDDSAWVDAVLDRPEVLGVEDIGPDGTTVRVSVRTHPDQRARVARELRARIGARLRVDGFLAVKDHGPGRGSSSGAPPPPTSSD